MKDTFDVHAMQYKLADLSFLDFCIEGVHNPVRVLHDSGAMISVVHRSIIPNNAHSLQREGTVKLRGLFGDAVDADLVLLIT